MILQNTSYAVEPAMGARELLAPDVNLQESARACCSICHDFDGCNTFQWCAAARPASRCLRDQISGTQ